MRIFFWIFFVDSIEAFFVIEKMYFVKNFSTFPLQRIRHYMDWSKNTTQFLVLKEIHSTFLDCFLTTAATSTKSEDDGKPKTQIKCIKWNELLFHWYVKREQTKKNTFWQIYMTRSGFKQLSQLPICLQPFPMPS